MFQSRLLDQQIDLSHPLVKLATLIPWDWFESELSSFIDDQVGPTMATLKAPPPGQASFVEGDGTRRFDGNADQPRKSLRLMDSLRSLIQPLVLTPGKGHYYAECPMLQG